MFSVIEFREGDGGGVSIVNSKWLTPRKQEVYWPPIKDNLQFEKVIRKVEQAVDSTWKLYPVERIFYTSDEYEKAKEKRNKAQITSDIKTDSEIDFTSSNNRRSRRQRRKPYNVYSDSESTSNSDSQILSKLVTKKKKLPRPPVIQVSENESYGLESTTLQDQEKDPIDTDTCRGKDFIEITAKGKQPAQVQTLSLNSPGNSSCINTPTGARNNSFLTVNRTSTTSLDDNGLQDPVLKLLLKNILTVKEQNRQILDILRKKDIPISTGLPLNLDVTLPVESLEQLEKLESYLQDEGDFNSFMSFSFSISNSKDLIQKTNRILRSLVKDTVAKQFNYFGTNRLNKGTNNKRAFNKLLLNKIVQGNIILYTYLAEACHASEKFTNSNVKKKYCSSKN